MAEVTPYNGTVVKEYKGEVITFKPYSGEVSPITPKQKKEIAKVPDLTNASPFDVNVPMGFSESVGAETYQGDRLKDTLKPAGEVAKAGVSVGQEFAQFPLAGIAGIAGYYGNLSVTGNTDKALKAGTESIEKYIQKNVYQPKSKTAQHAKEVMTQPIAWWARFANAVGTKVAEKSGSPDLGAVAETITFLGVPEIARRVKARATMKRVAPEVIKREIVEKVKQGEKPAVAVQDLVDVEKQNVELKTMLSESKKAIEQVNKEYEAYQRTEAKREGFTKAREGKFKPYEGEVVQEESFLKPTEVKEAKPKATQRDMFGLSGEELKQPLKSKEIPEELPIEAAKREAEGRRIEAEELARQEQIFPEYDRGQLEHIKSRIEAGEAGGRVFQEETREVSGFGSTYPDWYKGRGLEKNATIRALDKAIRGEKLTETQRDVIAGLVERSAKEYETYSKSDYIDNFWDDVVTADTMAKAETEGGYVKPPFSQKMLTKGKEFFAPLSTIPESAAYKKLRYKALGQIDRAERSAMKIWKRTRKLDPSVKHDMFRYLDGQIELESLPPEARSLAQSLRTTNNLIGKMLVRRGMLSPETFAKYKNQYIRYTYLKHILGDKPVKMGSGGRLDLDYLKQRKDLTKAERRAIGLIEDVSVAEPISVLKPMTDIAKHDMFVHIADNPDWTWQPSVVKTDIGKMGIGALAEEVKIMRRMHEQAPKATEIKTRLDTLERALNEATIKAQKVPEDFVQLPNSENYGPLRGAFVRREIARDIQPIFDLKSSGNSHALTMILDAERKGMAAFKVGKVALNWPTAFRNIVSNVIQLNLSGIPLYELPFRIEEAVLAFKNGDPIVAAARRRGVFRTNWGAAEIGEVLDTVRTLQKKSYPDVIAGLSRLAKYYGKIDDFFKLTKFIEQTKKGVLPDEAAIQAQKWGMDYSLVHPAVGWSRRHITPFITYQYKIAPLIAEAMVKRPWVLAKYLAIPYLMAQYAKQKMNISEKEWEKLRKTLPLYIRKENSYMVLPWRSPEGQVQWVNLEYFFPWGNIISGGRSAKEGDIKETIEAIGIGNPYMDVYTAFKGAKGNTPPKDPFTGRDIYNQLDSPKTKAFKSAEWLYNKWAPTMLQRYGALGYTARVGEKDRYGRTTTPGQAFGRWFGLNIVAPTPQQTALEQRARMKELRASLARIWSDPTISKEDKEAATERYREEIRKIQEGK